MIKVIDAPCGAGKTSWAIQHIQNSQDEQFIYCTPFLDEITRIRERCGFNNFKEPQPFDGRKIDDFNSLIANCENIAVTHSTFLNATTETIDLLSENEYVLILDEVADVVTEFNRLPQYEGRRLQEIKGNDIKYMLDRKDIVIDGKTGLVTWTGGEYGDDFLLSEIKYYAELKRLYCVMGKLLVTIFPPEIFSSFKDVYVLTYMFDGSILKPYFELFNLDYFVCSVVQNENKYELAEYTPEADITFRKRCAELITVCEANSLIHDLNLTKTGMKKLNDENMIKLKNSIRNFFNSYSNKAKAQADEIMWTTFNDFEKKLEGQGYIRQRKMTSEEKQTLTEDERKELEKTLKCFVPCNAKATNLYGHRRALAYICEIRYSAMVSHFFLDNNNYRIEKGLKAVELNNDAFTLSNLIQWVFRSRIRNGEPITVYVPSKRARKLFKEWLSPS